jgi:hypothetical protein
MISLTASNGTNVVNDDLAPSGKEAVMVCFNILSQHLFGNTEKNHRKLLSV